MPPKRTRLPSKSEGSSVKNDTGAVKRKRMADSPSLPPPEKATYDGPIDEDEGDGKTMTPADLQFLKDCLKFVVGGTVVVRTHNLTYPLSPRSATQLRLHHS